MTDTNEANQDKKPEAPKAKKNPDTEFRRTRRVPTGYSYNVRDGIHKTPKKGK